MRNICRTLQDGIVRTSAADVALALGVRFPTPLKGNAQASSVPPPQRVALDRVRDGTVSLFSLRWWILRGGEETGTFGCERLRAGDPSVIRPILGP